MNLLQVGVKLKADNIQSFIDDFLKIDGINISDIRLHDDMILINKIKYKSFGTISIGLKFHRIEDGILSIAIKKLKAISIPINVFTVNFILKMVINKLNIKGISCDGKQIKIDLRKVFKEFNLNFLEVDIKDIQITEESINVTFGNVDIDMIELINSNKKSPSQGCEMEIQNVENNIEHNVSDINENIIYNVKNMENDEEYRKFCSNNFTGFCKNDKGYFLEYSRFRNRLYNGKFKQTNKIILGKIVFIMSDIGVLCYRLLRDNRVRNSTKILIGFTIFYLLSPIDFINNKFSILDKIDDGLLLVFTLNKIFVSVDREILNYHFDGDEDTLNFLMDSFDLLNSMLGMNNIDKLYSVFEKFVRF
ncbi:hypothetical protein SFBM_0296 [Candidatus Arthromitus sp. SFB-mouse-Japan]|uniref:YkvA family protein n=1 Tax=Candidatus Arthromitus sp. SFB-mouse TaxID=49118 RepID=UPI00021B7D6C|nr:YkvA family protein [Candidatus Arthromitus sp. SFB-mouse]EIA22130.1 hypothetical protein SFB3_387G3 [Candidatus Arthromitus sp. SFB-3]EIA29442.1 hypothetical protein SFB6_002G10 [Candidatus Arthromitus sp. SFB-co]EIA30342.1 hypothetical protein SFBSU_006G23 [Candidatus Arthromitus sp. SFB-mouse-SU]EGX29258.1 hypothetical protein SFBNYU_013080 [Candidatus Arthromitus sp. SFB-mouse-NYU]BAK56075.1 hypothetical protein SFBM_0296 [Candidatus Arthromitus sp. SFB-mouse-Japan]